MAKFSLTEYEGYYIFECPGCKCNHFVNTNPEIGTVWDFDGNLNDPTVNPSLLVQYPYKGNKVICHSFIRNGHIQFLNDSTHDLSGKTVELFEV